MVGLVIVSHSRELAVALMRLVEQVSPQKLPIAVAAGIGDDRSEFGTDAVEIMEAILSVHSPEGVLVLMDLGSAVLSAKMAVELLDPETAASVRFCSGPVVEGAIAAAVQIGLGSDLNAILHEARSALWPKQEQLQDEEGLAVAAPESVPVVAAGGQKVVLTLHNLHGLHARPAARFVSLASSFKAEISVRNLTNGKGPVSARSLNAVATLGAVEEHQVEVSATGQEAEAALQAISALVLDNFGEKPAVAQSAAPVQVVVPSSPENGAMHAVPISEGIAIGPLYRHQPQLPPISREPAEDRDLEWQKFQDALESTGAEIRSRRGQLKASLGEVEASIFDAHALILRDPELIEATRRAILEGGLNASAAWNDSTASVAESYRALADEYLQQRAADVEDVQKQVLFKLAGASLAVVHFEQPVILYAEELTPTETSQLDMKSVLGIMTVGGGPTSHSAILSRALGIPSVSGVSPALEHLPSGTVVAVNGSNGAVWVEPSGDLLAGLLQKRADWLAERQRLLSSSQGEAFTKDGRRVEVFANAGSLQDAQSGMLNSAEGIGLLRTEFLFLTRETPPDEAEQLRVLMEIGDAMNGLPVTVRTLDVGGDKEVPYIKLPPEPNPFLGVRAIRMSLRNRELFNTQLRAILRAAHNHNFRIMFPMIANVEEVRQAKACLEEAHQQLVAENLPHAWPVETGIMVEIPSAALLSPLMAREVDFFSIGTNDLTQYTLAAERGNPLLTDLADAFHPAVLRLIGEVAQAAHAEGKWVGICGELGGDPLAAPVLVGLGVDELSLNPGGIPRTKAIVRSVDAVQARLLAEKVLRTESPREARALAQTFLEEQK